MRPTIEPMVAARCGPVSPCEAKSPAKSTCSMAHRANDSTPTVRGRTSAIVSTSTEWMSPLSAEAPSAKGTGAGEASSAARHGERSEGG